MATIQVRDLPEDSYDVLRRRARRSGRSLQAYMRDQLVAIASRPTKEEASEAVEAILALRHGKQPSFGANLDHLSAQRR